MLETRRCARAVGTWMLLGLLAAGSASAQDAGPQDEGAAAALPAALAAIRDAAPADREAAVLRALALAPTASGVADAFQAGLPSPKSTAGWSELEAADVHEVVRPYHLYVPAAVAASGEPAPLLLDLHGGVSRPEYVPDEMFRQFRVSWQALADEYGFVLALPKGRGDCTWWSDAGVAHVRAVVRDVKRHAPIDDSAITATGFSDGGSGCWYLAMAGCDPFAALMPMNGSPHVAIRASGRQLYLTNAVQVPLFVAMTQDDQLYPGDTVLPFVQALFERRASVHLVSYPTGGHSPSYFDDLSAAFGAFVRDARRNPWPDSVDWELAQLETGSFRWVEVLELGQAQGDADPLDDVQVQTGAPRVQIGVRLDDAYTGPGVRTVAVVTDRPAAKLGMATGDVILSVDGAPTNDLAALRVALAGKQWGDPIAFTVQREGHDDPLDLAGSLPAFTPAPSFPRTLPSAFVSVRATGNEIQVTSRGVRGVRFRLSPVQFDLETQAVVIVNGVERLRGRAKIDVAAGLREYAGEADSGRWFPGHVNVTVPAAK